MKTRRRGSALIEFAGSLLLLGTVFAGVFQIGYTFFAYNTLVNAVRAGARYASLQTGRADLTRVQNLVVYGDLVPSRDAKPVVPGSRPATSISVSARQRPRYRCVDSN